MVSWPILSVTTFLPLAGALFIMLMRGDGDAEHRNARWVGLESDVGFGLSETSDHVWACSLQSHERPRFTAPHDKVGLETRSAAPQAPRGGFRGR